MVFKTRRSRSRSRSRPESCKGGVLIDESIDPMFALPSTSISMSAADNWGKERVEVVVRLRMLDVCINDIIKRMIDVINIHAIVVVLLCVCLCMAPVKMAPSPLHDLPLVLGEHWEALQRHQ